MNKLFASLLTIFITQSVFADLITQNTTNGCDNNFITIDNNNHTNMVAIMMVNQHACQSGQYLPANIDGCRVCPAGGTCNGGTYTFNETVSQGIDFSFPFTQSQINSCVSGLIYIDNHHHSNIFAIFEPHVHTCTPGYYLPANIDECTTCPVNHICSGGTYTFNETIDQGIEQCSDDTPYSPMGSVDLCYPHVLHIGDEVVYLKSDKLTTPSLNIGMNDGIFYANMTTEPTLMNKDSEHYLKLEFNNTVYYVCDDTTCGG